jgi:hypothetical protein
MGVLSPAATPRKWGCPICRCKESWVDETSRDHEGFVVRLRRCGNLKGCDGKWETEEVVMAPGSFWSRAEQRNAQRRERLRRMKGEATCQRCGGQYIRGFFQQHVARSSRHAKSLAPPANRSTKPRADLRRYQREWKRRQAA